MWNALKGPHKLLSPGQFIVPLQCLCRNGFQFAIGDTVKQLDWFLLKRVPGISDDGYRDIGQRRDGYLKKETI
jgi:hypothetical protein